LDVKLWFDRLPWEYGTRNLFRRPLRTSLTLGALMIVIMLILVVVGFIRGLEQSLKASGQPRGAIVFSLGMGENLEYSSIPARTGDLLAASVPGVYERYGEKYISPELYLGTQIPLGDGKTPAFGLLRGVTPAARLVRATIEVEEGAWPAIGEVMIGRAAATKLGVDPRELAIGSSLTMEGRTWRICGVFSAGGSALESELWCRLDDLQQALKRQDLSMVAVTLESPDDFANLDMFCKERLDLELQAIAEPAYYAGLLRDYGPVRWLCWTMVTLIACAGVFTGLNTMYGAVVGRVRELATLQTIGFARRAIVLSLVQEGVILAATATLGATALALTVVNGLSMRFTMMAFSIRIDEVAVLVGCGVGLLLGVIGALPPSVMAMRRSVVAGLRAI